MEKETDTPRAIQQWMAAKVSIQIPRGWLVAGVAVIVALALIALD